jgi:hypothetical protein
MLNETLNTVVLVTSGSIATMPSNNRIFLRLEGLASRTAPGSDEHVDKNYRNSGGDAFGGGSVGFACGGFVAVGEGSGGSASTCRVGEGKGKVAFLVLEFSFALSLALRFTPPMSFGLSLTSGETEVFVLAD